MKNLMKALVIVPMLVVSVFMGIYLLDGFNMVKVFIWIAACLALGQIIYKLLRVIDKKYKRPL